MKWFSLAEFACHDGTPYPVDQVDDEDPAGRTWAETRLRPLVSTLDVIREAVGKPIRVDSGYRTLKYDEALYQKNQAVGLNGKADPRTSQHPKGRAADIRCGSLTALQLRDLIGALYRNGRLPYLGGLGLYPSFVHVDVRPRPGSRGGARDGHLAQWGGNRLSNIA